jgi:hypothetical protein
VASIEAELAEKGEEENRLTKIDADHCLESSEIHVHDGVANGVKSNGH